MLITTVLAAMALTAIPAQALELVLIPKDDLWIYPHAGDPQSDVYLRVWGDGNQAVSADPSEAANLSYSYLQFDAPAASAGKKLVSATLTLTSIADPKYTEEQAKAAPIEVRPVTEGFSEKTWAYDQLSKFYPSKDKKSIFGTGFPSPWPMAGQSFKISINLLKGPGEFRSYLGKSVKDGKSLALALTSSLDVASTDGVQTIYKVFSKDSETATNRPTLTLRFE